MYAEKSVTIRFYQELNDFLPEKKKEKPYKINFSGKNTIKDLIEAEGVPHVEIDLILVNGISVDFKYYPQKDDRISVYPEFELLDISPITRLRPLPLRTTRFIADANLSRLSRYLRMLGFDTRFDSNSDDPEIIDIAAIEKRIILTRDLGLLKNSKARRGYFIRSQIPDKQIREVVQKFSLKNSCKPFTRCIACNGEIYPANKKDIIDLLPDQTAKAFVEFFQCRNCKRIYWKGSHYEKMLAKVEYLTH